MVNNNKKRVILLSLLLLIILVTGVFIIIKNEDNSKENKYANQNETFQESKDNEEKEADKFHYVEEFVGGVCQVSCRI